MPPYEECEDWCDGGVCTHTEVPVLLPESQVGHSGDSITGYRSRPTTDVPGLRVEPKLSRSL